ncbi:MAG: glycerophosphodiester phosphodiesterase family protein [Marmoricola sp.]
MTSTARPVTGYPCLDRSRHGVLAIAHRGGAGHPDLVGLENTRRAFRHAVELGYRYLETDVHATADGVVVAFHDDRLDRVSDHSGPITELTAAQLGRVRVGSERGLPTMAELLEEFPDCTFNIDLKASAAVAPLAELLDVTGCHDRACVGSFSQARIDRFRRTTRGRVATAAAPAEVAAFRGLPSGRLARRLTRGRVAVLQVPRRRGALEVVTPGLVRRAHAGGAQVHVWTVDRRTEIDELLGLGVDGIITDRTDVLKDVLADRGLWEGGS